MRWMVSNNGFVHILFDHFHMWLTDSLISIVESSIT
jgi:hypothetical protein